MQDRPDPAKSRLLLSIRLSHTLSNLSQVRPGLGSTGYLDIHGNPIDQTAGLGSNPDPSASRASHLTPMGLGSAGLPTAPGVPTRPA